MPKISIIVPVYKVEPYLRRCIDSILSQTFADFELILVDDGSPDRCGEICDEYARMDCRVRVIHQSNGGLSAARNTGMDWVFENSESQWITFVDSDDYLHPTMLAVLLDAVVLHDTRIGMCGYAEVHGDPLDERAATACVWTPEKLYREHNVNATVAWGKLYHKDCWREIRYPVGKLHEDEFTTYRILFLQSAIAFVDAPLYGYFMNDTGIMKSPWHPGRMDVFEAFEEQIDFFNQNGYADLALYRASSYIGNVLGQINLIYKMPNYSQYRWCVRKCREKLRKLIKEYRKSLQLNLIDHFWVFACARPYLTLWYRCLRKSQVLLGGLR